MENSQAVLDELKEDFQESYGTLAPLMNKMLESHRMYSGDQWTSADAINSRKKKITPLVYNLMKGNVDILTGIQRQNKTALKALPEETGDNITASIASNLLHHSMRKGNGYTASGQTFKDMVIGALGWISPYIDFREDIVNGDLRVISDSVFDIFFDPHTKEMDLSDCNYIIKRKVIAKHLAKLLYPDHAEEIESSNSDYKSDYYVHEETGLKNKVVVKEHWKRSIEKVHIIFFNGEMTEISHDRYKQMPEEILEMQVMGQYEEIVKNKQVMNLSIVINDNVIVYAGKSPYQMEEFPFVPCFGFYNKSMEQWVDKLQSVIDPLKDPQREINKWNSSQLHYMLSSIHEGWIVDKGAVDDMRILTKGMSAPVIQRNVGKSIERIPQVQPPVAMMQQAQINEDKFNKIGLPVEMLGQSSNIDSAKGLKLRQQQGLAKVGEITENFNYAFMQLGRIALAMVLQFYTLDKVKKILGQDYAWVTQEHLLQVKDIRHNIEIDETTYNPTNKKIRLESLMEMKQYGVEDITSEDFFDLWDIDASEIVKLKAKHAQRQQQAQQQQAQQAQVEQGLIAQKTELEKVKADNMKVQTQLMGTKVIENLNNMGVPAGAITAEHEKNQELEQIDQAMQQEQMQHQANGGLV